MDNIADCKETFEKLPNFIEIYAESSIGRARNFNEDNYLILVINVSFG